MLFAKKKKTLDDQFAVYHEREAPRFEAGGGITIAGFEGEGLLKNVCVSGCCLESVTYIAVVPGQVYEVTVLPGGNVNLEPFTVSFAVNWTKSSELLFEAGFSLQTGQKSRHLEKYVEQLRLHGVEPEYGNMSLDRRH